MQNKAIFLVLISFLSQLDASPSKLVSCLIGSSKKRDYKPVEKTDELKFFLKCYNEFYTNFGVLDQNSECKKYLPVLMASKLE